MAGIGNKISMGVDKLLHKKQAHDTTATGHATPGTGAGFNSTSGQGYGTSGTGVTGGTGGTSMTGAGAGMTGAGTGTGMGTGTGSYTTGTTTGATAGQGTSLGSTQITNAAGEVINRETFTKTHDNTTLLEKREYELQHNPVQEQYVVETKYVGDRQLPGRTEFAGSEVREVDHQTKEMPRQDQTLVVENVDATTTTGALGGTTTGTTGTTGGAY